MPKAFPIKFRRDVVAVARKGEAPLSQVAKDFGISESCLRRGLWGLRRAGRGGWPGSCQCGGGGRREGDQCAPHVSLLPAR